MKKFIILSIFAIAIASWIPAVHADEGLHGDAKGTARKTVTVFFNEACQGCKVLVKDFYPGFFEEYGYGIELRDYVNERENRTELSAMNERLGIPFELQSHIEAFVGDRLVFGGHVPEDIMRYLLEHPDEYDRLLVFQDKMHGDETDYRVWDFEGEIRAYPIDEPITTYLRETKDGRNSSGSLVRKGFLSMFLLVSSSAFLDGLNPCAFAVLLFFIAFLFSMRKLKEQIWKMGLVYVGAIFLAYFLIGIGIAQAFIISGAPHLMAYIGSVLVIVLGLVQIAGAIWPKFPIRLRIPLDTKATLEKWMFKSTLPATFIGGFLVGLCTFPCSGGIYVAIIGMLAAQRTFFQGLGWMVWYNLIFILPLIILLIASSNPKSVEKLQILERAESKKIKLAVGAFMVALGAVIILFFT